MATVRQVKRLYNPTLDLEGVLLTMYDGRLNLTQQVVAEVKKFFPRKVFSTPIPAASVYPKRPASVNRSDIMMGVPVVQRPMNGWRTSWFPIAEGRRKRLGG